jgi:NDP-sugar pyrophosphorylase family protein
MIPALVLTAGLGTRLRPLSLVRAKAALPVAGDPLARRILRWLAGYGVTDAVLNLHHLPHTITGVIGDGTDLGMRVRYSWETPVLGSAGGPRRALPLLGLSPTSGSSFLIVNGDTLTDVDVAALVADHNRSGALVTMAAIPNTEPAKYSGLALDADGAFTGVVPRGSAVPSYHFIGVQVAEAAAFASLADHVPSESVGARYPALVAERRGSVRGFVTSATFFDIGTPGDYLRTSLLLETGARSIGARSRIDPRATIEETIVWDDVDVGVDVRLHRCVVTDEETIVWDDVDVGVDVRLHRCVVTDGVRVPAGSSWEHATIRVADGELTPAERRVGDLAIGSIL